MRKFVMTSAVLAAALLGSNAMAQSNPPTVSFFGDSWTATAFTALGNVSTVSSVSGGGLGTFVAMDRAMGGLVAESAVLGNGHWPYPGSYSALASQDLSAYHVFRFGGNEVLLAEPAQPATSYYGPYNAYFSSIVSLISSARQACKKPILVTPFKIVGAVPTTFNPRFTPAAVTLLNQIATTTLQIGAAYNVPVVNLSTFQVNATDLMDGVHPNAVQYHRVGKEIGRQIKDILAVGHPDILPPGCPQ